MNALSATTMLAHHANSNPNATMLAHHAVMLARHANNNPNAVSSLQNNDHNETNNDHNANQTTPMIAERKHQPSRNGKIVSLPS
jgi:hypothetical protein